MEQEFTGKKGIMNQGIPPNTEAATRGVLLLKISQNSQENNCVESLFNKIVGLRTPTLLKRDSTMGAFL